MPVQIAEGVLVHARLLGWLKHLAGVFRAGSADLRVKDRV